MNTDMYDEIINVCQNQLDHFDEQNGKIIIVLDDDKEWLETIKLKTKGDQNIVPISDTEKFRAFIQVNGCSKMYININIGELNGIDLAEELGLKDCFGDIIFVSSNKPNPDDFNRIDRLGANFVSKSILLDKIIYPKGE